MLELIQKVVGMAVVGVLLVLGRVVGLCWGLASLVPTSITQWIEGLIGRPLPFSTGSHLITIPFSHYCEKARWALDYHNRWAVARGGNGPRPLPYAETAGAPGFHALYSTFVSYGLKQSVPMLLINSTPAGGGAGTTTTRKLITDSTDILVFLSSERGGAWLYPDAQSAEALRLEEYFDEKLGPSTRIIAYYYFLNEKSIRGEVLKMISENSTHSWERAVIPWLYPAMAQFIQIGLGISERSYVKATNTLSDVFAYVESVLADGREYLAKTDGPSAADITFASLSYPVLFPTELNRYCHENTRETRGPIFIEIVNKLRATKAGQFALKIYTDHRFGKY